MKKLLCLVLAWFPLSAETQVMPTFYGAKNPSTNSSVLSSNLKGVADIDNDGHVDLIGISANYVRISYLDGAETFTGDTSYLISLNTVSDCDTTDLNHDGYEDIVGTARGNISTEEIFILMSDSIGRFTLTYTATGAQGAYELALGDFDNDGYTDASVATGTSADVAVFYGNASYTFDPVTYVNTGSSSWMYYIAAGDYNNDGRDDIAVGFDMGVRYAVLISDTSSASFQVTNYYPLTPVLGIKTADFNHDGNLDLAYACTGGMTVVPGIGAGAFPPAWGVFYSHGPAFHTSRPLSVADVNGDSYHDIIVPEQSNQAACIFLNDGAGSFYLSQRGACGYNFQFADFNEDGYTDMYSNPGFNFANGDGTGIIPVSPKYDIALNTHILAADLNNDGYGDVFAYDNSPAMCSAHLGNASCALTMSWSAPVRVGQNVTIGDFTGDGNPDFASYRDLSDDIIICEGDGSGGFSLFDSLSVATTSTTNDGWIANGDMNNDGNLDLVYGYEIANNSCYYEIRLSMGNGTFAAPITGTIAGGYGFNLLEVGLINSDNIPDIVIRHMSPKISVLYGIGNATYATALTYNSPMNSVAGLVLAHMDYDNYVDICISNFTDLEVHYGNAAGTYNTNTTYFNNTGSRFACTDLNGDWYTDLAYSGGAMMYTYMGDGNRNFLMSDTTYLASPNSWNELVGVDIDNDGKTDLVDAGLVVFRNATPGVIITGQAESNESVSEIKVFPNPASEQVLVTFFAPASCSDGSINVYTIDGRLQQCQTLTVSAGENNVPFNVSGQQAGVYLVEINSGYRKLSQRLVIR
jgi:hypothetical protein